VTGLVSSGETRLIANPATQTWVLVTGTACWLVANRLTGLTLCGYCEMSIDPAEFARARAMCLGRACLREEKADPVCRIALTDWTGHPAREDLEISGSAAEPAFTQWLIGRHPDNWLDLRSSLYIEGADAIALDLYLPPRDPAPGRAKGLVVRVGNRAIHQTTLARGRKTRVEVPIDRRGKIGQSIDLEFDYAEPNPDTADIRLLGCVVSGCSVVQHR
jgi:hypothetical protein